MLSKSDVMAQFEQSTIVCNPQYAHQFCQVTAKMAPLRYSIAEFEQNAKKCHLRKRLV
jgi:hypothetical protein